MGGSDDQMLTSNTSYTSTASLPRIKKKPKSNPPDGAAGPSGLQDVPVDLGFRDESKPLPKDRKKVSKSKDRRSKDRKMNSLVATPRSSGRDSDQSQRRGREKVSHKSGKKSQQTGNISQQTGNVSKDPESEIVGNFRKMVPKPPGKTSKSTESRRNKLPMGAKVSRSPKSVKLANQELRNQVRNAPSPLPVVEPPPPPSIVTPTPAAAAPAGPANGAQVTFTFDATSGQWTMPNLPGFSFTFTGAPIVSAPVVAPPVVVPPVVKTKSRRRLRISGRVDGTDSETDDSDVGDKPSGNSGRDLDLRGKRDSVVVSVNSDCTTNTTGPSRDTSDVEGTTSNTSTSDTPRRRSSRDESSSSSNSSSSSSSSSDSDDTGVGGNGRDDNVDPDALRITTENEFSESDAESNLVVDENKNENDADDDDDANNIDDNDQVEEAVVEQDADGRDPPRIVNPPAPVDGAPAPVEAAELDDEEFGRILNDIIDRDVPNAEVEAFRRGVPRESWTGTVNVIRRLNHEREHFRARIRYLRGFVNPTHDESMELENMIVFQ